MRTKIKNGLIVSLSFLFIISVCFFVNFNFFNVKAETQPASEQEIFEMTEGASVRIVEGQSGIRFETKLNVAFHNKILSDYGADATVKYYTIINKAENPVQEQAVRVDMNHELAFDADGNFKFYSSIIYDNVSADKLTKAYGVELYAQSFAEITKGDGEVVTVASKNTSGHRSMRAVASHIYINQLEPEILNHLTKYFGTINDATDIKQYCSAKDNQIKIEGADGYTEAYEGAEKIGKIENGILNISSAGRELGRSYEIVLFDSQNNIYRTSVAFASTVISSKEDFTQYMNQSITPNSGDSDYVVVTNDIDMEGTELNHTLWLAGTIDGQGHIIKNFMSWSALRSNTYGAAVKNLGLVYTKKVWVKQYSGVLIAGQNRGDYENVFVDVTYVRDSNPEVDSMAILGDQLDANTRFKNCVFNVRLKGEGCNKIFADYTTSDSGASFENTYIISQDNIEIHEENQNNGLFVVASANDIPQDNLGGMFAFKTEGLCFNNYLIKKNIVKEPLYVNSTNPIVDISALGIDGVVKGFNGDTLENYSITDNILTVSNPVCGKTELVLQTSDTNYIYTLFVADFVISTAEEYTDYITNTAENYRNQKYAVLKNDIDLNGATVNSGQSYWSDSILDGTGHIVKNFTTSYLFTTGSFWGNHTCVLKNIGLEFTFNPAKNGGIYCVDDIDCWDANYTNENVWMNITINRNNFNTALFATQFGGTSTFKNMVINVNVSGEGEGQLWADYITKKDNSKIENVYVIDNQNVLSKHNDFDETASPSWKDLSVISNVSGINDLGGMFELKTDGLYFNDKLVLASQTE